MKRMVSLTMLISHRRDEQKAQSKEYRKMWLLKNLPNATQQQKKKNKSQFLKL